MLKTGQLLSQNPLLSAVADSAASSSSPDDEASSSATAAAAAAESLAHAEAVAAKATSEAAAATAAARAQSEEAAVAVASAAAQREEAAAVMASAQAKHEEVASAMEAANALAAETAREKEEVKTKLILVGKNSTFEVVTSRASLHLFLLLFPPLSHASLPNLSFFEIKKRSSLSLARSNLQVATARAALRDAEKSLLEGATSLQTREVGLWMCYRKRRSFSFQLKFTH